ncbi:hypothetical protein EGR_10887 [Echinococcus granulosus]|uniref:Uncharacterized protein n=1 Tax=Echinococcus granulosus TaxID=6210 RepID=W6UL68_ECHGR|nr:hypothetical protein EGR_10887 [Echinococcus granulosus]EUB54254.1 hypothetical protein EGR_10887 [Echinococcus granulosus]
MLINKLQISTVDQKVIPGIISVTQNYCYCSHQNIKSALITPPRSWEPDQPKISRVTTQETNNSNDNGKQKRPRTFAVPKSWRTRDRKEIPLEVSYWILEHEIPKTNQFAYFLASFFTLTCIEVVFHSKFPPQMKNSKKSLNTRQICQVLYSKMSTKQIKNQPNNEAIKWAGNILLIYYRCLEIIFSNKSNLHFISLQRLIFLNKLKEFFVILREYKKPFLFQILLRNYYLRPSVVLMTTPNRSKDNWLVNRIRITQYIPNTTDLADVSWMTQGNTVEFADSIDRSIRCYGD